MPVMDWRDPQAPEAVVVDVTERFGCLFVFGKVHRDGEWVDAQFTVPKGDIDHMSRDQFHAYAARRLPQFCVDVDWRAMVAS
jgi:hypothetical protein